MVFGSSIVAHPKAGANFQARNAKFRCEAETGLRMAGGWALNLEWEGIQHLMKRGQFKPLRKITTRECCV